MVTFFLESWEEKGDEWGKTVAIKPILKGKFVIPNVYLALAYLPHLFPVLSEFLSRKIEIIIIKK